MNDNIFAGLIRMIQMEGRRDWRRDPLTEDDFDRAIANGREDGLPPEALQAIREAKAQLFRPRQPRFTEALSWLERFRYRKRLHYYSRRGGRKGRIGRR